MRWLLRFIVTEADRRAIESDLAELFELRRRHERRCRGRALAPAAASVLSNAHHDRPHSRFPRRNGERRSSSDAGHSVQRTESRAHARVDRDNRAHRGHRPGRHDRDGRRRPRRSGQPAYRTRRQTICSGSTPTIHPIDSDSRWRTTVRSKRTTRPSARWPRTRPSYGYGHRQRDRRSEWQGESSLARTSRSSDSRRSSAVSSTLRTTHATIGSPY